MRERKHPLSKSVNPDVGSRVAVSQQKGPDTTAQPHKRFSNMGTIQVIGTAAQSLQPTTKAVAASVARSAMRVSRSSTDRSTPRSPASRRRAVWRLRSKIPTRASLPTSRPLSCPRSRPSSLSRCASATCSPSSDRICCGVNAASLKQDRRPRRSGAAAATSASTP